MSQFDNPERLEAAEVPRWFHKPDVITIEGLAATGKGAASRVLCEQHGFNYVSISSIGRGLAVSYLDSGLSPDNEGVVREFYADADVAVELSGMTHLVSVDGRDVTPRLFDRKVSLLASQLMRYDFVRYKVYEVGHSLKGEGPVIFDGRRVAEEAVPGAELQVLLIASMEERLRRRYTEEYAKDPMVVPAEILRDLETRDRNEIAAGAARATSPGYIVDTTEHTPEGVVRSIIDAHNIRRR